MRIVLTMQTTLDGRIAHADGSFWEPFAWGEPEQAYLNHYFRAADTWAMSRVLYDAVVPFWDAVAQGQPPDDAGELGAADRTGHPALGRPGHAGPDLGQPGLVDELVIPVHPAVISDGPRLFDAVPADLALTLAEAQTLASGCVVLHYLVG